MWMTILWNQLGDQQQTPMLEKFITGIKNSSYRLGKNLDLTGECVLLKIVTNRFILEPCSKILSHDTRYPIAQNMRCKPHTFILSK